MLKFVQISPLMTVLLNFDGRYQLKFWIDFRYFWLDISIFKVHYFKRDFTMSKFLYFLSLVDANILNSSVSDGKSMYMTLFAILVKVASLYIFFNLILIEKKINSTKLV